MTRTIEARRWWLRSLRALALVAAAGMAACAQAARADTTEHLVVGGVSRTYVLHVPPSPGRSMPLVLSFHGHGGTGDEQSHLTGFDALADRDGFIVAYPDGIDRGWNDGRPETAKNGDDLAFASALIDALQQRYNVDPKRIYATGFSNGAIFSNYLACNESERIAAIAPVSGTMPVADAPRCKPKRAIPVLEIDGTADPIVPYNGGEITLAGLKRGQVLSAPATAAFWAKNAGCSPDPATSTLPPIATSDGTTVTSTTYSGCSSHASVVLYTIQGGGHAWPGGPQYLPALLIGPASRELDASDTIIQFFLAHPMT